MAPFISVSLLVACYVVLIVRLRGTTLRSQRILIMSINRKAAEVEAETDSSNTLALHRAQALISQALLVQLSLIKCLSKNCLMTILFASIPLISAFEALMPHLLMKELRV